MKEALVICRYEAALDDAICSFFADARRTDGTLPCVDLSAWQRFVKMSANRGGSGFFVVEDDGRIVALCTSSLPDEGVTLRHFRIIVHPRWRGRGIGNRLLERVGGIDQPSVVLQTLCPASWEAARRFYLRRDFAVVQCEIEMTLVRPETWPEPAVPTGVRITAGSATHCAEISRMSNEAYRGSVGFFELSATDIRDQLGAAGAVFAVALAEGGALVGFSHVIANDDGTTRLESLVVAPHARRRHLGRALLCRAIGAVAPGATVHLGVSDENAAARSLYLSVGFVEHSRTARLRRPI